MAKPTRSFTADVGQKSVGQAGPDYIEQDLDDLCAMFDPTKLLHTGQDGGIGPDNCKDDWQVDQTQSPVSNTGSPQTLLGRLANRIKAIMGKADWKADPDTTLAAVKTHMDDASKHSGIASIEGIANPGGEVHVHGGTGISISTNPATKEITVTATGQSTPGPHASSHATGGSDPVTPASIGAETPAGAQSKVDTHAANVSAHHSRYTDAEAVAAIKLADGHGSLLDADTVDGCEAGTAANNVLKLDSAGKVPLANLPILPAALALRTSFQSIPSLSWTEIQFPQEEFDTDAIHDNAVNNARLTCKTAGIYAIFGYANFSPSVSTQYAGIAIAKNSGTNLGRAIIAGTQDITVMALAQLAVNDYIRLLAFHDYASSIDVTSARFGMVKVG